MIITINIRLRRRLFMKMIIYTAYAMNYSIHNHTLELQKWHSKKSIICIRCIKNGIYKDIKVWETQMVHFNGLLNAQDYDTDTINEDFGIVVNMHGIVRQFDIDKYSIKIKTIFCSLYGLGKTVWNE